MATGWLPQLGSSGDFTYQQAQHSGAQPSGMVTGHVGREFAAHVHSGHLHSRPQLQWLGKGKHARPEVDVVCLHVHERISPRAILEAVRRPEPVQLSLFGDPQLPFDEAVRFYRHGAGWTNRLILGDCLLIMNSLLLREGMAGEVQMVYMDPPYGISYSPSFQPIADDGEHDQGDPRGRIVAYRDTWTWGIHSYLSYLRQRLLLCRELLADSGSIFLQTNDENVHLVRCVLDEVFSAENFVGTITFVKTSGKGGARLDLVNDYLLWYAKDKARMKYRQLYLDKELGREGAKGYQYVELPDGTRRRMTARELRDPQLLPEGAKVFMADNMTSQSGTATTKFAFQFRGKEFTPGRNYWKTNRQGLQRLARADRLFAIGNSLRYVRYLHETPVRPITNLWTDTGIAGYGGPKIYAVQTNAKVVERCILMTTDPGDLVFDPTCGSGTTAYCAEKWGRRWIACDTSRVALSVARRRLMTATYDFYELRHPERGPAGGFIYQTVRHVTLRSIARNSEIDHIAGKYQPRIDSALTRLNRALSASYREWEVPRVAPSSWPSDAREAHCQFWDLRASKRREIAQSIQNGASQRVLYDRPRVKRGIKRVCGPFTVEAIPAPVVSGAGVPGSGDPDPASHAAPDYLAAMLTLLQQAGGVIFPDNRRMELQDLRPLSDPFIHAEAEAKGRKLRVAISFGPPYGPVTAGQVRQAIRAAGSGGYDILILAGFGIEPAAQQVAREVAGSLPVHFAYISSDALLGDLLKTTPGSEVFTVFGHPQVSIVKTGAGSFVVELEGIRTYDPVTGQTRLSRGSHVAAWFLDSDYDGLTFRTSQAFFPGGKNPWRKLQRAVKAHIDPEAFRRMRGTRSFPFRAGRHGRIAVKVLDFRGNEAMVVMPIGRAGGGSNP